jgi:hypothetical protein
MASKEPRATPVDYFVVLLSPALIMGMVGSLVFFLAEVLYGGQYSGELRWLLFFFVFGSVLVARISMMAEIANRAWIYGPILCLVVWAGMMKYVKYSGDAEPLAPLINLVLVVVGWGCSHKLTWDCTHVDDEVEVTGQGLLQAAGFEAAEQRYGIAEEPKEEKKLDWFQRWQRYRQERKKRRTPGVWVVYFAIVALPLFGLGQALIPVDAEDRRREVFWLMVLYVGCSLGLLLTTCFLGLRRYLRQRKTEMSASMTGVWLVVGGTLVVVLLVVGALLPRPHAEYSPLPREWFASSEERDASDHAQRGDSAGKDDGNPNSKADPEGKKDGARDKGKDGSGGDRGKGKDRGNDAQQNKDKGKNGEEEKSSSSSRSSSPSAVNQALEKVGEFLKKIVFIVVIVLVVLFLLLALLRYFAPFTSWVQQLLDALARFWSRLFGKSAVDQASEAEAPEAAPAIPPPPFRAYPNPYLTGQAETMSLRDVIKYTFAAVEAWGREEDCERRADETPLEFLGRLGESHPDIEKDLMQLANLYAHAVYGEGALPRRLEDVLRRFWERLEAEHASAGAVG